MAQSTTGLTCFNNHFLPKEVGSKDILHPSSDTVKYPSHPLIFLPSFGNYCASINKVTMRKRRFPHQPCIKGVLWRLALCQLRVQANINLTWNPFLLPQFLWGKRRKPQFHGGILAQVKSSHKVRWSYKLKVRNTAKWTKKLRNIISSGFCYSYHGLFFHSQQKISTPPTKWLGRNTLCREHSEQTDGTQFPLC